MNNKTGIWIDQSEAHIITFENEKVKTITLPSGIEDFHPKGGARGKTPWGAVDTVSEKKYLERQKNQEKTFFSQIIDTVQNSDQVYLFGPAETKKRLATVINEQKKYKTKVAGVVTTDKMTENQRIASVKSFFNIKSTLDI